MVALNKYPAFFARFYDTIYDQIRDSTDHQYFMNKILDSKGPVLEIGVGTGRFFMDALNQGADIYGIDISPAMLDILRSKLPEKEQHRIQVEDICTFNLDQKFDLIIAPFRVFMHLITIEEQFNTLDTVYAHLNPGGSFIFDLFVPNLKMLHEGLDQVKDFEGDYVPGKKLVRYSSMQADLINQISHVTFKLVWDEDGIEKTEEWNTDLRFFFRYELEHLINQSKLQLVNVFGDFKEHELSSHSKEFIVVCKRPGLKKYTKPQPISGNTKFYIDRFEPQRSHNKYQ